MEEVLLDEKGVRVTTREVQVGDALFRVAEIRSVHHARVNGAPALAGASLLGLGLFLACASVVFLGLPGLLLAPPAILGVSRYGRGYVVVLGTRDGERRVLLTRDAHLASLVRATIDQALWKHEQRWRGFRRGKG
jgi:hypothetical protein